MKIGEFINFAEIGGYKFRGNRGISLCNTHHWLLKKMDASDCYIAYIIIINFFRNSFNKCDHRDVF